MIDPFLVMKSCRDNGQFETNPDKLDGKENAFSFFSPHYPAAGGTVTVLNDAACVFFDDKAFHESLKSSFAGSIETGSIQIKGTGWLIKDLHGIHSFWNKVRQIIISPPSVLQQKPIQPSSIDNSSHEGWKIADFDPSHDEDAKTEDERLQKIRKGQEIYRKRQETLWDGKCAVTGISNRALLRASHAIPWKDCKSAEERLDPYNVY